MLMSYFSVDAAKHVNGMHTTMALSWIGFALLLMSLVVTSTRAGEKIPLVIGGFGGIIIKDEGWSSAGVIPAIELALERVNNHSSILKDYYLVIDWKDSRCTSGHAIKGLVEFIGEAPPKIAVIGPGCSIAAYPTAEALLFWNLTQISFSATSPGFSNKVKYPNFYRVNPSETIHDPAIVALAKHFKWRRLFIIKHELRLFNSISENLKTMFTKMKMECQVIGFFNNSTSAIERMKKSDARIVILFMYATQARDVVCSAFKNGFYGNHIVWILRGWYLPNWWKHGLSNVPCTVKQMEAVLINVISIEHASFTEDEDIHVMGLNKTLFLEKYKHLLQEKNSSLYQRNIYAPYGFDAVLTLAKALNETEEILKTRNQSLREFNYSRHDITAIIKDKISKIDVEGLTGGIKLNKHGDRIVNIWIQQLQGYDLKNIAMYYTENKSISFLVNKSFQWQSNKVPLDRIEKGMVLVCISRATFISATILSSSGIIIAFYFLWINVKNGGKEFFKISSPPLNNFIILGAIFSYLFIPIHGLKSCAFLETVRNSDICKAQVLLFCTAFTLIFGTIFVKTWRVYKIFTNVKLSKQLNRELTFNGETPHSKVFTTVLFNTCTMLRFLSNKHLMGMIFCMILFDVIYLSAWNIAHPLHDTLQEVYSKENGFRRISYQLHKCTSQQYTYWFWGVVGYKGLLLLFGTFLTWETRHVSFPGLNDSKNITLCVYNMVIFSVIVTPVAIFAFPRNVDISYGITAISIIFCTTTTLFVMFVPKIRRRETSPAQVVRPSTLDQSNDDSKNSPEKTTYVYQCPMCKR